MLTTNLREIVWRVRSRAWSGPSTARAGLRCRSIKRSMDVALSATLHASIRLPQRPGGLQWCRRAPSANIDKQVNLIDMLAHYHSTSKSSTWTCRFAAAAMPASTSGRLRSLHLSRPAPSCAWQHTTQAIMQRRGRRGPRPRCVPPRMTRAVQAIAAGVKARDKPLVRIVSQDDAGASEPPPTGARPPRRTSC